MDIATVITPLASFVGAWIAAQLALQRFYREKVWERKTAAYSAIFEALYDIDEWHNEHLDALESSRELSSTRIEELRKLANEAKRKLEICLARESWILPTECRHLLEKLIADLKVHYDTWSDFLNIHAHEIGVATDSLRILVRSDLKLGSPWYIRLRDRFYGFL